MASPSVPHLAPRNLGLHMSRPSTCELTGAAGAAGAVAIFMTPLVWRHLDQVAVADLDKHLEKNINDMHRRFVRSAGR